jgi:hypothetical protein
MIAVDDIGWFGARAFSELRAESWYEIKPEALSRE